MRLASPTLIVSLAAALLYCLHTLHPLLIYDREAILGGEIWRLFTGHWVHFSAKHLGVNLFVFGLVGMIVECRPDPRWRWMLFLTPWLIGIGLFICEPQMSLYGGFSGMATAAMVFLGLTGLNETSPWRWVSRSILVIVVLKIALEWSIARSLFFDTKETFITVPLSHALGALGATLVWFVLGKHRANRFRSAFAVALILICPLHFGVAQEMPTSPLAKPPEKKLPFPGEVFLIEGHTAFVILPDHTNLAGATPWVLYAPTLAGLPGDAEKWMFRKFLDAGIAIAGIDVGESFGNPKGRSLYTSLYNDLVKKRGFSIKACLLARSRGGLMLYNWAAEHPDAVACIAGIYPVCDLRSYPGLKKAAHAYDLSEEALAAQLREHNPIERLAPLAKARVPILHLHGTVDAVVPLENNSGELAERYRKLGGDMTLKVMDGKGHDMWSGWFESEELVKFVISNARK